jgi:Fur family ferric uptake transcriptional regulator
MDVHHAHGPAPAVTSGDAAGAAGDAAWVEGGDLVSRLRERGLRVTAQREQVLAAVRRLGHATPEEIAASAGQVDPATVYRTLELLEELGLVGHTHLGHGAPSYQPVEDQHSHVVCHSCGGVVDADPAVVDDLVRRLYAENGFVVDRSHLTVFGRCAACAGEQTPASGR